VRMIYARSPMPNSLRTNLNALAAEFASSIIQAIQDSSLAEILDIELPPSPRRGPGRPRGSATKVPPARAVHPSASTAPAEPAHRGPARSTDADAELVVKYLRSHPGTTGEAARRSLGREKNRWNTCVARAILDGKIRKQGERRSTRHWTA